MAVDAISILNNLIIKEEYTLEYGQSEIISGLKKLSALFLEIAKITTSVDTDKRIIALVFT